jgi:enoyl-CoA hydratase/carnithine racemase
MDQDQDAGAASGPGHKADDADVLRLARPAPGVALLSPLLGLMPGGGATQRLTRAVGKFRSMRMLLTGSTIHADEAYAMGLVSDLVADTEVEATALALAGRIADLPIHAVRAIKEAVLHGMEVGLDAGLAHERKAFQLLFATDDTTEGIRARLEKRPPNFGGR